MSEQAPVSAHIEEHGSEEQKRILEGMVTFYGADLP